MSNTNLLGSYGDNNGLVWTAGQYVSGWLIEPDGFLYAHSLPTGGGAHGPILTVTNGVLNVHIAGSYYTE